MINLFYWIIIKMQEDKSNWPELEGTDSDKAVATILLENGSLDVQKVDYDSMVTFDYREDRVRVFYNPLNNLVSTTPTIG